MSFILCGMLVPDHPQGCFKMKCLRLLESEEVDIGIYSS